uniref:Uncharacterized protein n=1 Tax=Ditylenchus dipsaci TaxID=166011 RepID=A0A915EBZ9_9BILA
MIVIILCAIFYILYIPCSFSLFKRRENACYKLMLYICLIDCSALWLLGFCKDGLWMTESAAQIFLAVNRCIAILSPNTETFFFKGSRTYFWLTIVTFYGIYVAIFTKPQLYTGIIFSWAFNPYLGYIADTDSTYVNYVHTVHDTSIAIILPSIYVLFYLFLLHKSKGSGSKAVSNKQKMLFIQILIIGFIHLVGCLLYASFTYINYPVESFTLLKVYGFLLTILHEI